MPNSKARVLLLHPRPTPGDSCTIPYSCLAVAAPLVQQGHHVRIIDEFTSPAYFKELAQAAREADVAGISCFTGYQIDSALRTARFLREHAPGLPIVWGGYHPSLYPHATVQSRFADFVIAGQGEWIFLDFVNRLANGEDPSTTPGVWHKRNGHAEVVPGAPLWRGLEDFPPFPFHLVALKNYLIHSLTPRSISYHSSLGCPFRCNFCTVTEIYHRRWSGFPAERVLREVRFLIEQTGARSVEFYDNNFFVNDQRTCEIAEKFLNEKLDIVWSAEARPDKIATYDEAMLSLLARSGLRWVFIGAESGHDEVLDLMERDHSVDDIRRAAEKLARHNIKVTFSFNIGYPGEPADNFDRTDALARELIRIHPQAEIMVYITTVYDPTPSYHRARELVHLATDSLERWAHLDQRRGDHKPWLSKAYSRTLHHYSLITFYATSFHHERLRRRHPRNMFLQLLHRLAHWHWRFRWYRSILDLRLLNRLFLLSTRRRAQRLLDMWSGRA